ncbi:uncharacterized protein rubcnl [Chanos chanos]|uniref:Uncharacterized protein rubcnl n=1 Tax=Chanos chanos TaxID=29144 RepID=A0A6J2WDX8_CHACN|nr:protein associated with UVRAG as autophagy enhancer [Chanos chanos]
MKQPPTSSPTRAPRVTVTIKRPVDSNNSCLAARSLHYVSWVVDSDSIPSSHPPSSSSSPPTTSHHQPTYSLSEKEEFSSVAPEEDSGESLSLGDDTKDEEDEDVNCSAMSINDKDDSDDERCTEGQSSPLSGCSPSQRPNSESEPEPEPEPDLQPRNSSVISRKRRVGLRRKICSSPPPCVTITPSTPASVELPTITSDTSYLTPPSPTPVVLAGECDSNQVSSAQTEPSVGDGGSSIPCPGSQDPFNPTCPQSQPRCVSLPAGLSRLLSGALSPLGTKPRGVTNTPLPSARDHSVSPERPHSASCKESGTNDKKNNTEPLWSTTDLDQENAHFVVVDMVLEIIEEVKWSVCRLQCPSMPCSAEGLAQCLVSEIRKQWFPTEEQPCNHDNLSTALQEVRLPTDTISMVMADGVSLKEAIKQRSRMRGTLTWAPPRFQIIFTVHPSQRRSEVVSSQHFLCAGCGTEIEPRYIKRLRYCNYLGKYFCDSCHGGLESMIPGRILTRWDFRRYRVCHFSRQLLDSIWEEPLFKLTSVAKNLYSQARELEQFRDLQEQLISIKKLLEKCRFSHEVLSEFQQLPDHLTQELHLFSMDDLVRVKRGHLVPIAKALVRSGTAHVENCELCQARGFICEFCRRKEVLFPFQRDTCTRCTDCKACFHISCFKNKLCPKCARIRSRREQRLNTSAAPPSS